MVNHLPSNWAVISGIAAEMLLIPTKELAAYKRGQGWARQSPGLAGRNRAQQRPTQPL